MSSIAKPKVIVFSDHLLYPSQTFIRAQAEALSQFEPVYAGSRRVPGLDLPEERTHTISQGNVSGRFYEAAFKLFGFAPAFAKRLGVLSPVLLHAHHASNGLRALPLARSLRVPLIVTFHGSDATVTDLRNRDTHFGHRRYLANKEKLQKGGTLFLAVSEFVRRKLLEQGFPNEKVLVHYTGVDTKLFHPANTEGSPLILFVGRLVENKGAEFLIRAVAEVQKQLPAADLVLIGEGLLRGDLEKQARESLRRWQFLGARGPDEVRHWMNRASVFCAPSVKVPSGQEEAFGMVYAEAQAVGKPVVAFDSGGVSEIVSHGRTGFLASERDWQALAGHLLMLLQDAEMRKRMGQAGRERVVHHFDLEQRTKVLEGIYARAVSNRTPLKEEIWPQAAAATSGL
jgi:colanic acid/amylovoran biosynthesis glycosyltransferase